MTFVPAFAEESELEKIWESACEENITLIQASRTIDNARINLKYKGGNYPLSFSTGLSSSFSDVYDGLDWYTTGSTGTLTLSKSNPGGNTIQGSINYGITRGFMNYFDSYDVDNIGYSHSPSLSLTVKQSMYPYFIQGQFHDPNVKLLKDELLTSRYNRDNTEKSIKESIAYYYVQYRYYERLVDTMRYYISYYDNLIILTREKVDSGTASASELWNLEKEKLEYCDDLKSYLTNRENLLTDLCNICGESISISIDADLPQYEIELFDYEPNVEINLVQSDEIKINEILIRQNYAPYISLSASIGETTDYSDSFQINYLEDKNYLNWTFSIYFIFDELFSPSRKIQKEQLENSRRTNIDQLTAYYKELENNRNQFEEYIRYYEEQLEISAGIRDDMNNLLENYNKLYERGGCSALDLEGIRLKIIDSENNCKNLEDMLWYYKWEKTQYK